MSRKNLFSNLLCSAVFSILSMPLMANPSVPAPKPITDDRPNIGQSQRPDATQLSRNKNDAGTASTSKEEASEAMENKKLDAPPTPPRDEVPMMSPASQSAPAMPPKSSGFNLNNTSPANNQQRMLNPHRPMDSGY